MTKFIQNTISNLIRLILPFIFLGFFMAGGAAVYISAVIEFETFDAIYPKSAISILLLVLTLEAMKASLIFIDGLKKDNEEYKKVRAYFSFLRKSLIVVSAICTLVYSLYNLSSPEIESINQLDIKEAEINNERELAQINQMYDQEIQILLGGIDNSLVQLSIDKEKEKKIKNKITGNFKGQRYEVIQNDINHYEDQKQVKMTIVNEKRRKEIQRLNSTFQFNVESIRERNKSFIRSGNKVILAALRVISFGQKEPSQQQYIILTLLMSFLLTVILELSIYAVFTIASVQYSKGFNLLLDSQTLKDTQDTFQDTMNNAHKSQQKTNRWAMNVALQDFINKARNYTKETIERITNSIHLNKNK